MECRSQQKNATLDMVRIFQNGYGANVKWYERAHQIMNARGVKQVDLQHRLGLTQSNVSRYLAGDRGADSIEVASRFAEALGVSPCELIFGIKQEQPPPPEITIDFPASMKRFAETQPISKEHYVPIRLLSGRAAAGQPLEVNEAGTESWVLIYRSREWMPNAPECYTCVQVQGQSMAPILADGDIVAVDHSIKNPAALDGQMVAFRINGGVTIKWLKWLKDQETVVGVPENKDDFDTVIMLRDDEIDTGIIGKIAWWWAKR